MARERMTQLPRTAVIPQLALGNDRQGAPPTTGGPGSRGPSGGKGRDGGSEVNLFGNAEGVVDLDAEITDGAFNIR